MGDCLVIAIDISQNDRPTMLITRSEDDLSFKVVNQIWDEEAIDIYHKLIGK